MALGPDRTGTDVIAPASSFELDGLELVVIEGPDRGAREPVRYGATRIGAAQGNHLRLTDPTVSRLHCEIRVRYNDVRIVDTGSTNGTFLDGLRIFETALPRGAVLRVGETALRVEAAPEPLLVQISDRESFGGLLGKSVEMRRLYTLLDRVSPTDTTVLVQGETGTGKEIVARAIHEASRRASGPFVTVDCGAIAESLMESELFGHVKGAFTGALADREGLIEQANGGTLFLDEIGELPLLQQPKLLRALEAREVRRVGSSSARPVNVRVVAATNRRLDQSVNQGTFREDLYYRLAVIELHLPPLRARRDDIPLLASLFYDAFSPGAALPPGLVSTLLARSWPGNVRELRNFIERTVSFGWEAAQHFGPPVLLPEDLDGLLTIDVPLKRARALWEARLERAYVRALLRRTGGSTSRAAEQAGVSARTLQRIMQGAPGTPDDDA